MITNTITLSNNQDVATNVNFNGGTPIPNGLPCPKCKCEMYDTHPLITLTTYPAQKNVHCSKCGYTGYRTLPL